MDLDFFFAGSVLRSRRSYRIRTCQSGFLGLIAIKHHSHSANALTLHLRLFSFTYPRFSHSLFLISGENEAPAGRTFFPHPFLGRQTTCIVWPCPSFDSCAFALGNRARLRPGGKRRLTYRRWSENSSNDCRSHELQLLPTDQGRTKKFPKTETNSLLVVSYCREHVWEGTYISRILHTLNKYRTSSA